jgi:hypothetical protein
LAPRTPLGQAAPIAQSGEERMAVTRQLGSFKTSMLLSASRVTAR